METNTQLCNVFKESTISISSGIRLENYLNRVKENWQNVDMQTNIEDADNDNDDDIVKGRCYNTKCDIENQSR